MLESAIDPLKSFARMNICRVRFLLLGVSLVAAVTAVFRYAPTKPTTHDGTKSIGSSGSPSSQFASERVLEDTVGVSSLSTQEPGARRSAADTPEQAADGVAEHRLAAIERKLAGLSHLPEGHIARRPLDDIASAIREQAEYLAQAGLARVDAERIASDAFDATVACADMARAVGLPPPQQGYFVNSCAVNVRQQAGLSGFESNLQYPEREARLECIRNADDPSLSPARRYDKIYVACSVLEDVQTQQ